MNYVFYTPLNNKHTIFGSKTMFWCWYQLMTRLQSLISPLNVNIETSLFISGDKIIKLFVIPVKEVKLVRPLNTFFSDPIFSHVVSIDLTQKPNEAVSNDIVQRVGSIQSRFLFSVDLSCYNIRLLPLIHLNQMLMAARITGLFIK